MVVWHRRLGVPKLRCVVRGLGFCGKRVGRTAEVPRCSMNEEPQARAEWLLVGEQRGMLSPTMAPLF